VTSTVNIKHIVNLVGVFIIFKEIFCCNELTDGKTESGMANRTLSPEAVCNAGET
jgi:hypothetical protein